MIREVEIDEIYDGKVTRIMNFGAFVEILPGREGLIRISDLDWNYVPSVEDVLQVGDSVKVKVVEIDDQNRINLSRKALLEKPEGYQERERAPREGGPREGGPREGGSREGRGGGGGRPGGNRGGGGMGGFGGSRGGGGPRR